MTARDHALCFLDAFSLYFKTTKNSPRHPQWPLYCWSHLEMSSPKGAFQTRRFIHVVIIGMQKVTWFPLKFEGWGGEDCDLSLHFPPLCCSRVGWLLLPHHDETMLSCTSRIQYHCSLVCKPHRDNSALCGLNHLTWFVKVHQTLRKKIA